VGLGKALDRRKMNFSNYSRQTRLEWEQVVWPSASLDLSFSLVIRP